MRKYLVIAGAAGALVAAWALPSIADTTATGTSESSTAAGVQTPSPSSAAITLEQMDVNKPFGDMAIDQTKQPADVFASLNPDQRTNLAARCNLIVPNADKFGESVPTWCRNYLDWRKANHPGE